MKGRAKYACACKAAAAYSWYGPTLLTCTLRHRFPIGGDTMSVTSGVVSRIEVTSYVHGAAELLAIQIDAAINSGNSGGPAFNSKGECVGIAFQSLKVHHQALMNHNKWQQHVSCLTTSRLLQLEADAVICLVHPSRTIVLCYKILCLCLCWTACLYADLVL